MSIMNHLNHIINEHDYTSDYTPFNIHCNDGISYHNCFYDYETIQYLSVLETNKEGREEYRVINKESIISIELIYQNKKNNNKEDKVDVMYE